MIRFIFILSFFIFSQSSFSEKEDWQLQNKNPKYPDITLYLRDYPNSKIPEFKAVTVIDSTMASILAVLLDTEACHQWVHQCKQAFSLQVINPLEQYIYQVNELPFVKDRDIILHAALKFSVDMKTIIIDLTARPNFCIDQLEEMIITKHFNDTLLSKCKIINSSRHIHIEKAIGKYKLRETENGIQVIWQQYIEPGGFLPSWLAKSQLSALPLKTLSALHTMVKEDKYKKASLVLKNNALQLTYGNNLL